jgi:enoyl-CoA hydratase/carnithine racemase
MSFAVQRGDRTWTIALNRPAAGNRLDAATVDGLTAVFEDANRADGPHAVVVTAVGPDFSLGRDRTQAPVRRAGAIVAEFERIQRLNTAVQGCGAVTIAAVRGRAEGAGLSFAARCDIVIVADDARLCFPEIPHGIPPTIVLSHFRYTLPRNLLGDLMYTGRVLIGEEAVRAGLAARCVIGGRVEEEAGRIAERVAEYDRRSIRMVKSFLARTDSLSPASAPDLGIAMYAVEMADRAYDD